MSRLLKPMFGGRAPARTHRPVMRRCMCTSSSRGGLFTRDISISTSANININVQQVSPRSTPGSPAHAMDSAQRFPIVLVPGWCGTKDEFGTFPNKLARATQRVVYSLDIRGTLVGSDPDVSTKSKYKVKDIATDIVDVLIKLSGDSVADGADEAILPEIGDKDVEIGAKYGTEVRSAGFHLYGWSLGGMAAQLVTHSRPDLIKSLMLVGTTPGGKRSAPPPNMSLFNLFHIEGDVVQDTPTHRQAVENFIHETTMPKDHMSFDEAVNHFLESERSLLGIAAQRKALMKFDAYGKLQTIECPTLVLHGKNDNVVSCANANKMAALIPKSTTKLFLDGGHGLHVTHTSDVVREIDDFLCIHDP